MCRPAPQAVTISLCMIFAALGQRFCARINIRLEILPAQARQVGALDLAADCEFIADNAPQTLAQALQLIWLYDAGAGVLNHGRLDDVCGPFLVADLAAGRLDEVQAQSLVVELWRRIAERASVFNGRVIIGGQGRRNPAAADTFAHYAIRATELVNEIEPQLTLRICDTQDPALLQRGLDAIGAGRTFPMLYWDEANIPAVQRAFGVSARRAESYLPYGCGEFILDHASVGTPNSIANALRVLHEVLFGIPLGSAQAIDAFDDPHSWPQFSSIHDIKLAFDQRVNELMKPCALWQRHTYAALEGEVSLLAPSLLMDDCLGRGKSLLEGGVYHLGGTMELYGQTDTGDSFAAIEEVVYRKGYCSLDALRHALLRDFSDDEALRQRLLRSPSFGNDDERADRWAVAVHAAFSKACARHAAALGLDSFFGGCD